MKKIVVGILGLGEVGTAIAKIISSKYKVLKKDLIVDKIKSANIDYLHVCIPYSNNFTKIVASQAKKNNPKLIIIHSTVAPGTSREIYNFTKIPTVHSPVMGVHPYLEKHIRSFKKIIGPVNKKSAIIAAKHLKDAGFMVEILNNSEESELGKLLDTTYYGWNIMFNKQVYKLCKANKVNFNNVYTKFNQIYNKGYSKIKPEVVRPVLAYKLGKIGGHCVIPNVEILESSNKTEFGQFILKENKKLKN